MLAAEAWMNGAGHRNFLRHLDHMLLLFLLVFFYNGRGDDFVEVFYLRLQTLLKCRITAITPYPS